MHLLHTLWFRYAATSLRNNGASMVLGALLLPVVKRYLKAEGKRVPGRFRHILIRLWTALVSVMRVRVTLAPKPPTPTNASTGAPTSTTMSAK